MHHSTFAKNSHALEEVNSLPLVLDQPRYRHYPGMKLGYLPDIHFFARQLSELALVILQKKADQNNDWVLTAPAFYQLPAAANLIARQVQDLLQQRSISIPLVEPRLSPQQVEIRTREDIKNYNNYSKNNLQQRIAERQRVQQHIDSNSLLPQFQHKSVIIINDINVTGTQQQFMQARFEQLQARECTWLYIFTVDKSLAHRYPDIEYQINSSQWQSLDQFAELLCDQQTSPTARCLGRLFNETIANFRYLAHALDPDTRQRVYELAQLERRYNGPLFADKMQFLAASGGHLHISQSPG
jgi:hypothetical protein